MSSAFVDPETMPDGLQAVVEQNPFTRVVTATRGLLEGNASWGDIDCALGFAALLTAIFMPLTIRLYRTKAQMPYRVPSPATRTGARPTRWAC